MTLRIAWEITGCGDYLKVSLDLMRRVKDQFPKNLLEKSPNIPFLAGDLQLGKFDFLLIMPSTSNTVVKIATGIFDTLLSNAVAQAMMPIYIFPADQKKG